MNAAVRTDAAFVCWSADMHYRDYNYGGAIIHVQNERSGGATTLCGISTVGWRYEIHTDFRAVGCKRCLKTLETLPSNPTPLQK